jgi:outer membrane protein OmpA-like peptidoglycan-associated protein
MYFAIPEPGPGRIPVDPLGLGREGCGCFASVARSSTLGQGHRRPPSLLSPSLGEPSALAAADVITSFAFDRTQVPAPEHSKLIRLARLMIGGRRGPFRLLGHTDPVGNDAYNLDLGLRRALEVKRQLIATLERMKPTSSRGVEFEAASAGERSPLAPNTTEAGRARNRRVDILQTAPVPPPRCRFDIAAAPAIEREAARRTLALSAEVARRFIRTVGAVGARGRFVPTVIDDKYWFAKLYEQITYEELVAMPDFRHPAFVMHFMPIFYDRYLKALDSFLAGSGSVSPLWTLHFTSSARPDNSSISAWMSSVRTSIVTGVSAHVRGDMAIALELAYRSYVTKYCLAPPPRFDDFKPDFFVLNRKVFERAQGAFLLHLPQFGPFPVGPEWGQFLFAQGQSIVGGLDLNEVFRWREDAWQTARRRLGQ